MKNPRLNRSGIMKGFSRWEWALELRLDCRDLAAQMRNESPMPLRHVGKLIGYLRHLKGKKGIHILTELSDRGGMIRFRRSGKGRLYRWLGRQIC
jgi:hypothetical protein